MRSQFRLTEPAIQDIEKIADYIARQSGLDQSERFLDKLDAKFVKISFPNWDDKEVAYINPTYKKERSALLVRPAQSPFIDYLI